MFLNVCRATRFCNLLNGGGDAAVCKLLLDLGRVLSIAFSSTFQHPVYGLMFMLCLCILKCLRTHSLDQSAPVVYFRHRVILIRVD